MKRIEFVYQNEKSKKYSPRMLSVKIEDIQDVSSINEYLSLLSTNKGSYYVFGKYNIIVNRMNQLEMYDDDKYVKDPLIRPSMNLKHKLEKVNVDRVLMDACQLKAFIDVCLSLDGYSEEDIIKAIETMHEFVRSEISQLKDKYWKIPMKSKL